MNEKKQRPPRKFHPGDLVQYAKQKEGRTNPDWEVIAYSPTLHAYNLRSTVGDRSVIRYNIPEHRLVGVTNVDLPPMEFTDLDGFVLIPPIDAPLEELARRLLNKITWLSLKGEPVLLSPIPYVFRDLQDHPGFDAHCLATEVFDCDSHGCSNEAVLDITWHTPEGEEGGVVCASCSVLEAVWAKMSGYYPVIQSIATKEYL